VKRSISSYQRLFSRKWRIVLALIVVVGIVTGALGVSSTPALAAGSLPCDIYAAAGTPCVAAHSTVRALFSAYNGNLYQVKRWSDSATTNIGTLTAGGYANAAAQDTFCSGTSCTITVIYDQSGKGNNLTIEGPGGNGAQDYGANAAALPLTVGGHKVYGLYVSAGVGYRDNSTSGIAKNGAPEDEYMVTSGTHVNNRCCFDYGNAETSGNDTGNGHMDAINFGTECWFSPCSGSGPWVQADLENGLFSGGNGSNTNNKGNSSAFVTALLKNNGQNTYAIKGGNAQSGSLSTWYNGAEPNLGGYSPMHQEGAIVLGTGGDNSDGSVGSFFEGVMTSGYPTDATDNAVQANIVSVGYSSSSSFPVAGTAYRLTNVHSGTVLDAVNCGWSNGTPIDLWASLGNTCQQWKFASAGNGTYTITNVNSSNNNSSKVLDAVNCGLGDGTAVDLWSSLGNTCQKWAVIPTGGGHYELVVENSGMVLDDVNCGTANGTKADLWQWLNNSCQEWSIAP
jgi:non-reducing end alpha-L-arabinofuranosidase